MIRKLHILLFVFVLGFVFCLTNGVADNKGENAPDLDNDIGILEGGFDFPTAEGATYIQGTPEHQRVPELIFGNPDFEKMRDLPQNSRDYQLGRKVGWLVIPSRSDPRRVWICTGFLVGPDLFMTNDHCINDAIGQLPLTYAAIFMDYYQEPTVDPTRGGITARVSEVLRADSTKDYALLRLDRPIGNSYGWLELDTTTRVNSSQSVKLISHNDGRSKEIVRRNTQIVDIPFGHPLYGELFAFTYLADSEPGSSGSPVFLRDGTSVIGIHHSGWTRGGLPHFNAGSLMSSIVPEIQQWLPGDPIAPPPPPTGPSIHVYWTDPGRNHIQRANIDGSNLKNIVTGLGSPKSIALDGTGNKVYWTDTTSGLIQRANLDGTNIQNIITGLANPAAFALDVERNQVYWTDTTSGTIRRANLDGTNIQNIITGLANPAAFALDVERNQVYWTDTTSGTIRRANLDGSNIQNIITGLVNPAALALDAAGNKVYWTDTAFGAIQRANLDGSNIQNIITGLVNPAALALDVERNQIYWADTVFGAIQRANIDGSNKQNIITGLVSPAGIALSIPQKSRKLVLNPSNISNQIFTINTPVSLRLPGATGGTAPYTYRLTPGLPAGLSFNAGTRLLSGTPTTVMLRNTYTYTATDARSASTALTFAITVRGIGRVDVNGDGRITVADLVIVAMVYGTQVPAGEDLPADVNADGVVDLLDLIAVANAIDAAGDGSSGFSMQAMQAALLAAAEQAAAVEAVAEAPTGFGTRQNALSSGIAYRNVSAALADANGDARLGNGIPAVLQELLQLLAEMDTIPETTALLPNYPNPFNPETWIPYHLATDADVTLTIYNVQGDVVRELLLGHQTAGVYESRTRAAYWDGRNQIGEKVASGVYFYTLKVSGGFTATRKLLIAK